MKIVKLKGGLGNQMFQYAFAKNIEMLTGEEVKLDISAYEMRKNDNIRRPRIFDFKIAENIASKKQIEQICKLNHDYDLLSHQYKLSIQLENFINRDYFFRHDCSYIPIAQIYKYKYFDGYWQAWRYVDAIKDELQKEFIPKTNLSIKSSYLIETLKNQNSVFIGIRKGDYSSSWCTRRKYGEFNIQYYIKSMKYISNFIANPIFYIFSNDIEWVKKNMAFDGFNICYRNKEDQISDFEEVLLMASCRHSIIVNSTFHWWGAWLNDYPKKIVIAPDKWFANGWKDEIIPPDWIKMRRQ